METLKTIDAHSDMITSIFQLSKNKLISCSNDKTIKIWDVDEDICVKTFDVHTETIAPIELFNWLFNLIFFLNFD